MASAFMTVAMMPMWSAETRSMPLAAPARPRKMLPPPMTSASCMPVAATGQHLVGEAAHRVEIDAIGLLAHQDLARELEEDALVLGSEDMGTGSISGEQPSLGGENRFVTAPPQRGLSAGPAPAGPSPITSTPGLRTKWANPAAPERGAAFPDVPAVAANQTCSLTS